MSRIRDKQKKKKKKNLPTIGFEPASHGCKTNTLTTRPPKLVLINITKMYFWRFSLHLLKKSHNFTSSGKRYIVQERIKEFPHNNDNNILFYHYYLNGPIRFLNTSSRFIILDRNPPGTVMNLPVHFPVSYIQNDKQWTRLA